MIKQLLIEKEINENNKNIYKEDELLSLSYPKMLERINSMSQGKTRYNGVEIRKVLIDFAQNCY